MKTLKLILTILLTGFCGTAVLAQQDPMISEYMTNGLFLNPAYAGSHPYTTVSMLYRKQWLDFDGSPRTSFATFDKKFTGKKVGLGFTLVNDKIGVTNQTDLGAAYSYHLGLGKGQLALGIKGSISYYRAMLTDLKVWDENDKVFVTNIYDKWIPNFGAGAYYYMDRFYAGISVPHLMNYKPSSTLSAEISRLPKLERHYYLTSGLVFRTPGDIYLKPSFLLKYVPDAPLTADLNFNVFFKTYFSVGASFRTGEGIVALFEMNATRRLRFGYAFDLPMNHLYKYTYGSHEFMLAYDLGIYINRVKTPRFF